MVVLANVRMCTNAVAEYDYQQFRLNRSRQGGTSNTIAANFDLYRSMADVKVTHGVRSDGQY